MYSTNASDFLTHLVVYTLVDTEEGTCVACGPNCGSCEGRPDHCTSCEHHLVLHDNQCYANCPVNTYETNDYR